MADKIYVRKGDVLEPMKEQRFDTEEEFQKVIANHPELLDGEQVKPGAPRRWILISREVGVPQSPDGADWWSLDHLLIDQDAIPTLVEVKRGDNSEVRRKVVGQMLDYAAHAEHWTADSLRKRFESIEGNTSALRELLDSSQSEEDWEGVEDAFWNDVGRNLAAKRLRLLFIADAIPDTLARVVAFLNEQMQHIEVLAVEIKQFKSESGQTLALVPRVSGHTTTSKAESGGGRRRTRTTREEFMAQLPDDDTRRATDRLFRVAEEHQAQAVAGDTGFTIRVKVRSEVWKYLITVAWLYPPMGGGWMGVQGFVFGRDRYNGYAPAPSEALSDVLDTWSRQFEHFGQTLSSKQVTGYGVSPEALIEHIDKLETGLAKVIDQLQAL